MQQFSNNDTIPASHLSVLPYDYMHPSSPTNFADCEAMFLDHVGWGEDGASGDLYLVTKWGFDERDLARVFKIPASAWPSELNNSVGNLYSPEVVGTYPKSGGSLQVSWWWTRADMSFDGTVIALGEDESTFLFLRCPGATVAETIASSNQPCLSWFSPSQGQVETFAWMPDGMSNLQIPEGGKPQIGFTRMEYKMATTTKTCPRVEYDSQRSCVSLEDGSVLPKSWCDVSLSLGGSIGNATNDDNTQSTSSYSPTDTPTAAPTRLRTNAPTLSPSLAPIEDADDLPPPSTNNDIDESETSSAAIFSTGSHLLTVGFVAICSMFLAV